MAVHFTIYSRKQISEIIYYISNSIHMISDTYYQIYTIKKISDTSIKIAISFFIMPDILNVNLKYSIYIRYLLS